MTYEQAKRQANKKNAGKMFTGEAGNGCTFEVYFCCFRNRQIWTTITKDGVRIV